jgi:hypothetical protein
MQTLVTFWTYIGNTNHKYRVTRGQKHPEMQRRLHWILSPGTPSSRPTVDHLQRVAEKVCGICSSYSLAEGISD